MIGGGDKVRVDATSGGPLLDYLVPTYFRGWDRLVRRQVTTLALWASFPLAAVAGAFLASASGNERSILVTVGAWATAAVAAYVRYLSCPCPRCRRPYLRRSALAGRVTSRDCAHCGLAKFTPYPGGKSPGGSLLAYRRYRRRLASGCCGYCGYSLRGTPDRCPECGEPAAGVAQ